MKNREVEEKIDQAFSRIAPDILDTVLSDCEEQKGRVILMTEHKKKNRWGKGAVAVAAALAVMLVGAAGFQVYSADRAVSSTVSLDVNPSIEIKVNKKERVLEVNALNEDGRTVVGDMDFAGSSLDVTVNALVGSMLRNGYLSELANSILVSVDNEDPVKAAELQEELTASINGLLQTDSFSGAVLSQTVTGDSDLEKLAGEYGITLGKAQLIRELTEKNTLYSFGDLARLSINELNLIGSAGSGDLTHVESVGKASDKAYIGEESAKQAAFGHAGISAADAVRTEVELGVENGVMVYEVDFKAAGFEYDYDIDAVTGAVVKSEKEVDDDYIGEKQPAPNVSGGNNNAGGSADNNADSGASNGGVSGAGNGSGAANGGANGNGAVNDWEDDRDDDDWDTPHGTGGNPAAGGNGAADIGEAKAKEAALTHAGLSEGDIRKYKAELDYENGVRVYEIEFKWGEYEYSYDIDAATGAVVKSEKEIDD